jgi:hypothetical protein
MSAALFDKYQREYQDTVEELTAISTMTDSEVCMTYNVDTRAEIVQILNEEIQILEYEMEANLI